MRVSTRKRAKASGEKRGEPNEARQEGINSMQNMNAEENVEINFCNARRIGER